MPRLAQVLRWLRAGRNADINVSTNTNVQEKNGYTAQAKRASSLEIRNPYGGIFKPTHGDTLRLGEKYEVNFTTSFTSYNIALWQEWKGGGGATKGPILYMMAKADPNVFTSFDWEVSRYDLDPDTSRRFILWMFEGVDVTRQGTPSFPNVSGGYFNITDAPPVVVTTSAKPPDPTTTTRNSRRSSSTSTSTTSSMASPSTAPITDPTISSTVAAITALAASPSTSSTTTANSGIGTTTSGDITGTTTIGSSSTSSGTNTGGDASQTGPPSSTGIPGSPGTGAGAGNQNAQEPTLPVSQVVPISVGVSLGVIGLAVLATLLFWMLRRRRKGIATAIPSTSTLQVPSGIIYAVEPKPGLGLVPGDMGPYSANGWVQSDAWGATRSRPTHELSANAELAELG
ncbi:hypothetical protein B0H63DRAFT_488700 [Podospora didyma]|uniref:Uncharacterized protein n=1 Tax=Podospora didyma TaxID=330526 RepID=A0AAE0K1V2_9PEZI|nr:hypothetical protein B0H63DRAFT_488700 [Podospora didyma]